MDKHDAVIIEWVVYLRAAIAAHIVIVIMQFFKLVWSWSSEVLGDMPDYDPRIAESGCGVLFAWPLRVIDRVRSMRSAESYR